MSSKVSSAGSSAVKLGAVGFMAIALGCAAFAAYLVGDMMSSSYTGTRVVPVVVASADLSAGAQLRASDFVVRDWPEDAVPTGAFHSIETLLEANKGGTPTVGILAGEPVVVSRLSGKGSGTGIASLIRPNMRAIALKVEDSVGFTGLVYPGAYVDVVATVRDPFGRGPSSRIAVQNARVLSLGMDADVATRRVREQSADKLTGTPQQGGTFVTLEVTPEDSEILSIARNEGKIDLILRNASDNREVETSGATPSSFSAFARDPNAVEPAPVAVAAPARTNSKKPRRLRRRKRRVQLVAHDENDRPAARTSRSGAIETYSAN